MLTPVVPADPSRLLGVTREHNLLGTVAEVHRDRALSILGEPVVGSGVAVVRLLAISSSSLASVLTSTDQEPPPPVPVLQGARRGQPGPGAVPGGGNSLTGAHIPSGPQLIAVPN
jgi:hypothetical protein